ncbi:hypothetical protein NLG97_g4959 [Lecanicillium saksenae]|uniref:Uncharacterized protein n=1 Tax=Lecanicillium saksenae TaxID=468837 RepID=A0ACC1QUE0_9HYPO|nr:hypothetical protein NLG97_g4959 [Lecanicillium saksenae]
MAISAAERMRQIHLGLGPAGYAEISQDASQRAAFAQQQEAHEETLLAKCPPSLWPHGSYNASCPRPILITKSHRQQLIDFHDALTAAVNDVVLRWWKDEDARFPERMPLPAEEEQLLRWIDKQQDLGRIGEFSTCQGSWRPDFLIEEVESDDGTCTENFRISEINARFPFNGSMHIYYGSSVLEEMNMGKSGLAAATDGAQIFNGFLDLFQHDKPLHLLKGEERGIDIPMFIHAVHRHIGKQPRLITPTDLRLVSDGQGGTRLCCLTSTTASKSEIFHTPDGEAVEEVHQVGLELHQHELFQLDPEMLRAVSLRCFNDMRTLLLVHDKRLLGVIHQELGPLTKRGVITPGQAAMLDRGIAHTILPGSAELRALLSESDEARHVYLLKPFRSGKGNGIVFGEDLSADEWRRVVEGLRSAHGASILVQRRVKQHRYDVILNQTGEIGHYAIVGTYHVVNGQYLGLGIWRCSPERITAISTGGSWMCTVMSAD